MFCLFVYVVTADRVLLIADLFLLHKQKFDIKSFPIPQLWHQ